MADIVLAIGTSHSPLLNSPAEDYPKHAAIDAAGRKLLDKNGKPCSYGELLEQADPSIKQQIEPEVLEQRAARCTENIARLSQELVDARLDALIVIGDDQHEQFFDDNMPAILIYWGDKIANNPLHMDDDAPQFWRKARSQYHEAAQSRDYPVDGRARPASDRAADRARLRHQPVQAPRQGARRRPRLRLRAPAHDDRRAHRADRAGGAQHVFPAQPAAPAPLL